MKMADIVSQHPKLRVITDRTKAAVNLAMEKVVAHHENPQQYPLPSDPKSLERAFHNLFSKMPNRKQKKMIEKAKVVMTKSAAQRTQIYGDLMTVNLTSSVSIVQQVKAIPPPPNFKLTEAEIRTLKRKIGPITVIPKKPAANARTSATKAKGRTPAPPRAVVLASTLGFFIDSLTCNKKSEITKDEINLAGIGFDSAGGSLNLAPFFVGKFKKGQTIAVGKNPFNFKLDQTLFPQTFSAGLFIIEEDLLHNSDVVTALINAFTIVEVALVAIGTGLFIAGAVAGSLEILLASMIVLLAGSAAAMIARWVLPLLADDISDVIFDSLTLDAPVEPGKQIDRTIAIEGVFIGLQDNFDGKYQAAVHWATV